MRTSNTFKTPLLSIFLLASLSCPLFSGQDAGSKLFKKLCSSCHITTIDMKTLEKNFFEEQNRLLNLKAPTLNMLIYAMFQGPKRVVNVPDMDMKREQIAAYLEETLQDPKLQDSIFNSSILRYFDKKSPVQGLSKQDLFDLADFFLEYTKHQSKVKSLKKISLKRHQSLELLLKEAKESGKYLIVEASSPTCHYCQKMDRDVFSDLEVQKLLRKYFILAKINVKTSSLPKRLAKLYRHITPSFFIFDANGTIIAHYPGSWTRKDFLSILKEHLPSSH